MQTHSIAYLYIQGVNKKAKKSNTTAVNYPEKAMKALRRAKRMASINDTLYDEMEEDEEPYEPSLEDQEANEQVGSWVWWDNVHKKSEFAGTESLNEEGRDAENFSERENI